MNEKWEALSKIIEGSSRISFFGGAGVSTESGIADFRSENGRFAAIRQFGIEPEKLLSHTFFMSHPDEFYAYYHSLLSMVDAKPNAAHITLASLEKRGKLTGIVTQNIDGLHQKAGSKYISELHGNIFRNYCIECGKTYPIEEIIRQKGVPKSSCGGIIRPDVVLYEEKLDHEVLEDAIGTIAGSDTLIVGGTSLAVHPAAGLISYFYGCNLILINKTQTDYDKQANLIIRDPIAQVLGSIIQS